MGLGGPKFDGPLDKRRIRILSALFMALSKRGHWGDAFEQNGEIHATATIGQMSVSFDIGAIGLDKAARVHGRRRPSPSLPNATRLAIWLGPKFGGTAAWADDKGGLLETKIPLIAAGLIVTGEERFRLSLREAEEWAEQIRLLQQARQRKQMEAKNRERVQNLRRSGELLREAEDIRALVARVPTS